MNAALIAAMNFLMQGYKKRAVKKEPSEEFKKEVKKMDGMGLYSALTHLKKK